MKRTLIVCLFTIFSCKAFTQPAIPEFGNISIEDLRAKECSFEKDAPAFYLVNSAKISFDFYQNGYYKITTEKQVRIKVLNQRGFEYCNISIPYIGSRSTSKINDLEAFIYTYDSSGAILKSKVEKKDIFKSIVSKKSNLRMVKFTFPNLQVGCIIEYRYEHIEYDTYNIDPWLLQHKIPVAFSYCEVNYPKFSQLDYRFVGQRSENEKNYKDWPADSSKKTIRKSFSMTNIHSFKTEPLMSSLVDNLKRIEFSLNPQSGVFSFLTNTTERKWSWVNTSLNLSPRFGRQFNVLIPGTENLIDSLKKINTVRNKINAVYQSVKKHIVWDQQQSMYPYDIAEAWKNKEGNSAEINLIILNILKKADVECYPILISTRDNGRTDNTFPQVNQFNGLDVLAFDSTEYYVLDGASTNHSCFVPPLDVVNRDVFIVMPTSYKWVNINEAKPLIKDLTNITAKIDKDGNIKGQSVTLSYNISRDIRLLEKNEDRDNNDLLANDAPEMSIDSSWTLGKENDTMPLTSGSNFHFSMTNSDNFFFLKPALFSSFRKNPFRDTVRSTDIDFLCNQEYTQTIVVTTVPELVLESVPKSITIMTFDSSMIYSRKIFKDDSGLFIRHDFSINKSTYSPDEYEIVHNFFQKVYGLVEEEIVFTRKK